MAIQDKSKSQVTPLDSLTGLRFIAALFVFCEHAQLHFPLNGWKLSAVGGAAVAFFYVLSGFILTYVYYGRLNPGGIWKFYYTRWARIWPLHVVCLMIFFLLATRNPFNGSWEPLKFFSHFFLLQSWVPDNSWILDFNGVAWSISNEMAFYAAFPLLLLAGKKRFWTLYALIGLLTISGALIANGFYRASPQQFGMVNAILHFNPLFRIFEFTTGMGVGFIFLGGAHKRLMARGVVVQTIIEFIALGSIVFSYWFYHRSGLIHRWIKVEDYRPIVYSLSTGTGSMLSFALVVWVFSWSRGLFAKLFGRRWFVYLGEISFAFYLVHQLIQVKIKSLPQGLPLSPYVAITVSLALALVCSALLFAVVEVPCKESLLAMLDRKWSKAWGVIVRVPGNAWRSGVLPATLGVSICSAFALHLDFQSALRSCVDPAQVKQVIARSRPEFRGVVFEGEARLHGLQYVANEKGTHIRMVWEALPGRTRLPFVHICDQTGQVLRQCNSSKGRFAQAIPNQLWVDDVFLDNSKLVGASTIGIGFYSPDRKSARVNQGPRSMSNHRLDIVKLPGASVQASKETLKR